MIAHSFSRFALPKPKAQARRPKRATPAAKMGSVDSVRRGSAGVRVGYCERLVVAGAPVTQHGH